MAPPRPSDVTEVTCRRCKQVRPADDFRWHRKGGKATGWSLCSACRRYHRQANREARLANARICGVEGCGKVEAYAGLCSAHYQRKCRGQDINLPLRGGSPAQQVETFVIAALEFADAPAEDEAEYRKRLYRALYAGSLVAPATLKLYEPGRPVPVQEAALHTQG